MFNLKAVNNFVRSTVVHSTTLSPKQVNMVSIRDRQVAVETCRIPHYIKQLSGNVETTSQVPQSLPIGKSFHYMM